MNLVAGCMWQDAAGHHWFSHKTNTGASIPPHLFSVLMTILEKAKLNRPFHENNIEFPEDNKLLKLTKIV